MFLMKSRWPGASVQTVSGARTVRHMGSPTDDSDMVLGGLELPKSDIDGDTTLTLSLELVEHPGCGDRVRLGTNTASRNTHHT